MDVPEEVGLQRQAAADRLVAALAASTDPVLAYQANLLAGLPPQSPEATSRRSQIANSPMARALLRVFEQDAKTRHHTYRKWQGPHWTLTCLAMIDYPPRRSGAASAGEPGGTTGCSPSTSSNRR